VVIDSKTNRPVSNAVVELDGKKAETNAEGKSIVKSSVGSKSLNITKEYYKTHNGKTFVGLTNVKAQKVELDATGRQVPITVLNSVTGKPLANAEVKVLDTTAKTDKKGKTIIVLPTTTSTAKSTVSLEGFNNRDSTIQITANEVAANIVRLTPAGQVYFLSNLNGSIDVVKTNLDGSGRQVVLKGTGREDANTTSLLASRDWQYLVLKARRSGASPALYLIDTSNDRVTEFDSGSADFSLIGWHDHTFIYDLTRQNLQDWQSGKQALKSYNAETGQLNILDQTKAEGRASRYAYQQFSEHYIVNNAVVYATTWSGYDEFEDYDYKGKSASIRAVQPNGQNKKDHRTFPAGQISHILGRLYAPQEIYYAVYNLNGKTNFYEFEAQSVSSAAGVNAETFNRDYPTFLLSPTGKQTFWTELRDGKNTLFVGNSDGEEKQQVASLSEYSPYGWFSDDYVLVARSSSELYIMPKEGVTKDQKPLKISDYYKPSRTYQGYGYGYGGL
jgi:hypothetical protein